MLLRGVCIRWPHCGSQGSRSLLRWRHCRRSLPLFHWLLRPASLLRSRTADDPLMGQTQTVYLPPWVPSTEAEKLNEAEFQDSIMKLSATSANLIAPHPLHEDPDFSFDWIDHRPFAEAAYSGDKRLHRLLPKLVPKRQASPGPRRAHQRVCRVVHLPISTHPSLLMHQGSTLDHTAPRCQAFHNFSGLLNAGSLRRTFGATTFRTCSPSSGGMSLAEAVTPRAGRPSHRAPRWIRMMRLCPQRPRAHPPRCSPSASTGSEPAVPVLPEHCSASNSGSALLRGAGWSLVLAGL